MANSEEDTGYHNIEINLSSSAESTVDFDVQPGPSLPNQRASVIVVQPTTSSEIRIDSPDEHVVNELQVVEVDHSSRESLSEGTASSPVFNRRRRRGKFFSRFTKNVIRFHLL